MAGGIARRGFGSMDPLRQREIASQGGKAAHARGVAHEWDAEGAARAGSLGGKAISADHAHMAAIGRRGAESRYGKKVALDAADVSWPDVTATVTWDSINGPWSGDIDEQTGTSAGDGGRDRERDAGSDGGETDPGGD